MDEKKMAKLNIIVCALPVFGLLLFCLIKPTDAVSYSERRPLAGLPEWKASAAAGFLNEFEKYAADQFPLRERFRELNALFSKNVLGKKEINEIYEKDGYLAKLEYDMHEASMEWSLNRLRYIQDRYLENSRVYLAVIPDKNYYLTEQTYYPYMDYEGFLEYFKQGTQDFAAYIELKDLLEKESYYYTDTHWKQECLPAVAAALIGEMKQMEGEEVNALADSLQSLKTETLKKEFGGVYYGQAALPNRKDELRYLTGGYMDALEVKEYDSGEAVWMPVYDLERAEGLDPYEIFLSGSKALLAIENASPDAEGELVLFRDSFGSSIAPLLASRYRKVTLVDIRYISPAILQNFVDFENADVLFLYSAQVLNNSVGQFIK